MGKIKSYTIVLLLLCVMFITGCKQQPVDERTLSVFELQHSDAMIQAYQNTSMCEDLEKAAEEIVQKQDAPNTYSHYGLRYYGTFRGCSVWHYFKFIEEVQDFASDGGGSFGCEYLYIEYPVSNWAFCVYRGDRRYPLSAAYDKGILSLEDMEVIAKRHYEYEQAVKAYEEGQQ